MASHVLTHHRVESGDWTARRVAPRNSAGRNAPAVPTIVGLIVFVRISRCDRGLDAPAASVARHDLEPVDRHRDTQPTSLRDVVLYLKAQLWSTLDSRR